MPRRLRPKRLANPTLYIRLHLGVRWNQPSGPSSAPLPLYRVAGHAFVSRPLPHKPPKLFLTFGSFASLNPSRHGLQLIPCPGWLTISILSQKVGAIIQKSDVGTIRYGHQLVVHGVAGSHGRKLEGDFVGEIWLEIYEIFVQNPRPNYINAVNVRT